MFSCSALPIVPIVARHSARTRRISPDGRRSVAMSPSRAISCTDAPAERASWPPRPGCSSTLWITVPTGIRDSGRQLPTVTPRQRQAVADRDLGVRAAGHHRADLQALRREDVALDAVDVVQQRDVRGAVRVVLDRGDLGRDAVARALEVDLAVEALGAPAAVAGRLAPVGVAAAGLLEPLDEGLLRGLLRDLGEIRVRHEAAPGAGRLGIADRHLSSPRPRGPGGS